MRGKIDHGRQQQLRRQQTEAELVLWQELRNRRLSGTKFRRQHRIGPYIVDFACLGARLVVELDGGQHLEQSDYDRARTRFLQTRGFRVLRFWNDAVFETLNQVLDAISAALQCPSPAFGTLSPQSGEREMA